MPVYITNKRLYINTFIIYDLGHTARGSPKAKAAAVSVGSSVGSGVVVGELATPPHGYKIEQEERTILELKNTQDIRMQKRVRISKLFVFLLRIKLTPHNYTLVVVIPVQITCVCRQSASIA